MGNNSSLNLVYPFVLRTFSLQIGKNPKRLQKGKTRTVQQFIPDAATRRSGISGLAKQGFLKAKTSLDAKLSLRITSALLWVKDPVYLIITIFREKSC